MVDHIVGRWGRRAAGLWFLILLGFSSACPSGADAASNRPITGSRASHRLQSQALSTNFTFSALGQSTQTLSGSQPTLDLFVPSPGRSAVGPDSSLTVAYSRSALLDTQNSAVSVYVNGVSVAGELLRVPAGQRGSLTAHIPAAALSASDFNHVQLSFTLRDRLHQVCATSDSNLNVTVYGWSTFHYNLRSAVQSTFHPDLAGLPSPFTSQLELRPTTLTVGMPDLPTNAETTAAGQVLARFGEDRPTAPPAVREATPSTLARAASNADVVVVGTPRDNPVLARLPIDAPLHLVHGLWTDASGHSLPGTEGIILETTNPWNRQRGVLAVTGNGQEAIARAATVLSSDTLRRLLHGTFALLPRTPHVPPINQLQRGATTLRQLGYHSTFVEGLGERDARFTFDLRSNATRDGTFNLVYGHSSTALAGLSSVRVDLNNQPVESQSFGSNDASRVRWTVGLPADQLQVGTNVLTVRFFLNNPGGGCKLPIGNSLWGIVQDTSSVDVPPSSTNASPDLHLVPFPLVVDGTPNGTLLVLPSRTVQQQNGLTVAVLLGAQCHTDAPQLHVAGASSVGADQLQRYTVLLDGMPSANPLLTHVAPYLPLQVAPSLQLTGDTVTLDASIREKGDVGIIEEFASPWNPNRMALLVSATRATLLSPVRQALFGGNVSGTVATIDTRNHLQTFDTRLIAQGAQSGPTSRPIKLLTLAGILVLVVLLAFTAVQRQQPKEVLE